MATYSAKSRKKYGTIKDPETGKKTGFPVGDKTHARLAMSFLSDAPEAQRPTIERKAAKFGVGPLAKKSKPTTNASSKSSPSAAAKKAAK